MAFLKNITVDRLVNPHKLAVDVRLKVALTASGPIDEVRSTIHTGYVSFPSSVEDDKLVFRDYKFIYNSETTNIQWNNGEIWNGKGSHGTKGTLILGSLSDNNFIIT